MKKKMYVMLAGLMLVTAMAGCSGKNTKEESKPSESVEKEAEEIVKEKTEEESEEADKEEEKASSEDTSEEKEDTKTEAAEDTETVTEKKEFKREKAFELLSNINIGWNLGNTMDSRGTGNTLAAETFWGNIKTTQEMIDAVSEGGFNAIRIPVTWAEHVGPAPEYKIDEAWMQRVKEIVDYAVKNDMYIMLNTHHEENDWMIVKPENEEKLVNQLSAIWKQIATEFKDYDEKLIFEGMNEPRCVGSEKEWNGGTSEERKVINAMNMAFVNTVRETGGNNSERLLVICTYGNSPANKALAELEIPEDDNIAVAIHMYTPYVFTYIPENGTSLETWDGSKKAEIVNTIKQLDMYLLSKNVPVVITEFGAQNKGNQKEIINWIKDYVGSMNRFGIKCFWWDNGFYPNDGKNGNENFAIFNRETLEWYEPEIKDALVNQDQFMQ